MKKQISVFVVFMLCLCQLARGKPAPSPASPGIQGPINVCIGAVNSYSVNPTAGSFYYWSVTPEGNVISSSPTNPANIQWVSVGTPTITVQEKDASGTLLNTYTLVVTVYPIPAPYITTNRRAACQTFDTSGHQDSTGHEPPPTGGSYMLDDAGGCPKVCEYSYVEYTANTTTPPAGSWLWTVTGGTIVSGSPTSSVIIVHWGPAGAGNITLTETNAGGCEGTASVCIDIIERPHAEFCILPNTTPVPIYVACLGTSLVFHDLSTAGTGSSIVNWNWYFGDGDVSPLPNPTHTYTAAGVYTATLVVTNACGCVDSFESDIKILSDPGPDIQCPAVVCENDSATYSTSVTGCATYNWTVVGGTIIAGAGTSSIQVQWASGDASGYGYVSLDVSGCPGLVCPGTTTIKVPIIQSSPVITGPTNPICVNTPVEFGLPLWPATRYQWGVIGSPTSVISGRDNNVATLSFTSPGTYTVHVWWQNTLRFCGGDMKFTVVVDNPPTITGVSASYCPGDPYSFSLSPSFTGDWTLSGPAGSTVTTGVSGISGVIPSTPGMYTISVVGAGFCPPTPVTFKVLATPPAPNTISGPAQVCFGQPYTYSATSSMPGHIFEWSIVPSGAGTLSAPTGNSVTVVWSAPGTISVVRRTVASPHCPGPPLSINVIAIPITPLVSGPTVVCANTTQAYSHGYTIADATTWAIFPPTAGSVTSGIYTPNVNVLWNNVPVVTVATVTATVTKCGLSVANSLVVTINPAPANVITASPTVCNTTPIVFTATCGAGTYTWDFGDGTTPVVVSGGVYTVSHTFTVPYSSTSLVPYVVSVTSTGTSTLCPCPPTGTATFTVNVIPGPHASISTPDPTIWCIGGPSIVVNFSAVITNNIGTTTYQWYLNGIPITGETNTTYTATTTGNYTLVVTDASGCPYTSNVISVTQVTCSPGACTGPSISMTHTVGNCGDITCTLNISAGSPTSVVWSASPGYTSLSTSGSGSGPYYASLSYDIPGYYTVFAIATYSTTCVASDFNTVTIPLIAHYYYDWDCTTSPYTLNLHDLSDVLAGFSITNYSWTVTGTGGGTVSGPTAANPSFTGLSVGVHTISYTVTSTGGGSCTIVGTVNVPAVTSVNFTASPTLPSNICEGVPIVFTKVVTGSPLVSFIWNFGDGSTSLFPGSPSRSYNWSGPSNPQSFPVNLSGTNEIGCPFSVTHPVNIYRNTVTASVTGPHIACSPTIMLTATPAGGAAPYTYAWAPTPPVSTTPTDVISVTGSYYVRVTDVHQCSRETSSSLYDVTILNSTPPTISGNSTYCYGDVVTLGGYMGAGYTYQWYLGSFPITGATGPDLIVPGLGVGTYNFQLQVVTPVYMGVTCTLYSAVFPVTINSLPPAPTISGPFVVNCPTYDLKLIASSFVTGATYTWSGGSPGYGPVDIVNHGGGYRCWLTDLNGCVSHADIFVPQSPETYRDWFPAGCYEFCTDVMSAGGIMLYGPPGVFNFWDWLLNSSSISSGFSSVISPIAINAPGAYELSINNGLCGATFGKMDVQQKDCQCKPIIKRVTIVCDPDPNDPHGYIVTLTLNNTYGFPITVTAGMGIGPLVPFSIVVPPGPSVYTFNFTTLTIPPPGSTEIWLHYQLPWGDCYDHTKVVLPACSWTPEKPGTGEGPLAGKANDGATGMGIYPNPTQDVLNVNYIYMDNGSTNRHIKVYDALGRMIADREVTGANGTISISLGDAANGIYLVKMEENGHTLHVQRLSVTR